jgi:hypothetical protein
MNFPYPLDVFGQFEAEHVQPRNGRTLVVGSRVYDGREDRRKRYREVIGIDMLEGDGVDIVLNLEHELPKGLGVFRHIECVSVLEHSEAPWLLAANLERLMAPDGSIYLSVPFIWRVHSYPNDNFRFTANGVRLLFKNVEWQSLLYGTSRGLHESSKVPSLISEIDHSPYLSRASVLGFGVKK